MKPNGSFFCGARYCLAAAVCAFAALALSACASTKAPADSYGGPHSEDGALGGGTELVVPDSVQGAGGRVVIQAERRSTFAEIMLGKNSLIELGTFELGTENTLGGVKKEKGTVYYNTELGLVGFYSRYLLNLDYVYFKDNARALVAAALDRYLEDFAAHALKTRGKTYKEYAEVPVRVEWGTIPTMIDSYANTKLQVGYRFVKRSPYFAFTVWQVENEGPKKGATKDSNIALRYYFTKAQAQELLAKLTDEYIDAALEPYKVVLGAEDGEESKEARRKKKAAPADEY
ncbi:MAG: hypothetical protein J1D88_05675 [Treponema sp.]|nr:hypothetical protein [Treponema sp.]